MSWIEQLNQATVYQEAPSPCLGRERVYGDADRANALESMGGPITDPQSENRLNTALACLGFDNKNVQSLSGRDEIIAALEQGSAVHFPQAVGFGMEYDCSFICRGALLRVDQGVIKATLFESSGRHVDINIESNLERLTLTVGHDNSELFSHSLDIPSVHYAPFQGLYQFLRFDWNTESAPVAISPLTEVAKSERLLELSGNSSASRHLMQPTPELTKALETAGIDINQATMIEHPDLKIAFLVPRDAGQGLFILATDGAGGHRALVNHHPWDVSLDTLARSMTSTDFRWIGADGRTDRGLVNHLPRQNETVALQIGYPGLFPIGRLLETMQSVVESATSVLSEERERSFQFNISNFVERERLQADQDLNKLAVAVDQTYRDQKTFIKGTSVNMTPEEYLEQLQAICPHGLRESKYTDFTFKLWKQMGINPDSRLCFQRADDSVSLDCGIYSKGPLYTVNMRSDLLGERLVSEICSRLENSDAASSIDIKMHSHIKGSRVSIETHQLEVAKEILQSIFECERRKNIR